MTARCLAQLPAPDAWPHPDAGGLALPTQTAAWVHARASVRPAHWQPQWWAVAEGSRVDALAPLVRDGRWLRELPALFEPSDFAWRDEHALQALADALAAQPLPLQLDRVPATSPTLSALRRAYARRGVLRVAPAMPTPLITLDARWADPDRAHGARRRADFRRFQRRASAHGALRIEVLAPMDVATLDAALGPAMTVESRSWKAAAGTALTVDAMQGRFFAAFLRDAASAGVLRIALLWLGDEPAAMQIAAEWRQRWWLFKIAHDSRFDHASPGQLLMRHTLDDAARRGLQAYELMGVMADWTRLWTTETRAYVRVQAYPYSLSAATVVARRLARRAVDRVRGRSQAA